MPTPYAKPPLSIAAQLELLRSRGMTIENVDAATRALMHKGYYRLSAYWYPQRKRDATGRRIDAFDSDASFDRALSRYEADRHLRLALLDAVERVEVSIRTAATYHFAHAAGPFGYADAGQFDARFQHSKWLARVDEEIERSEETFVHHFRRNYSGFPRVPIWMVTEVISFGSLSRLVAGLLAPTLVPLARQFGVHDSVLKNWIHAISVLRNLCAHHARIWNREFGVVPRLPRKDRRWTVPDATRVFPLLLVLRHMLRVQSEGDEWARRVEAIVGPLVANPRDAISMGLPADWTQHAIWRR